MKFWFETSKICGIPPGILEFFWLSPLTNFGNFHGIPELSCLGLPYFTVYKSTQCICRPQFSDPKS